MPLVRRQRETFAYAVRRTISAPTGERLFDNTTGVKGICSVTPVATLGSQQFSQQLDGMSLS